MKVMGKYSKSGCNECIHSKSNFGYVGDKYTLINRECMIGNTNKMIEWWDNNGHKKSEEVLDSMDCQEYSEFSKLIIDMSEIVTAMLEELGKNIGEK